jgi:hypothetical protein
MKYQPNHDLMPLRSRVAIGCETIDFRADESFAGHVVPVLPRRKRVPQLEYKVAKYRHERNGAFHLVYRNYVDAGLIEPNRFQLRVTRYHLLPGTSVFIGIIGDDVRSTVSLVRDSYAGLPMDCIFREEVDALRYKGYELAEVSCLANQPTSSKRDFLAAFVKLNSLMAQSAKWQGVERLLIVVHPRHAHFYERFIGFQAIGEVRPYPAVENHPAQLLCLNLISMPFDAPEAYERFFGAPIPTELLEPCQMSPVDQTYFLPMTKGLQSHFVPIPA